MGSFIGHVWPAIALLLWGGWMYLEFFLSLAVQHSDNKVGLQRAAFELFRKWDAKLALVKIAFGLFGISLEIIAGWIIERNSLWWTLTSDSHHFHIVLLSVLVFGAVIETYKPNMPESRLISALWPAFSGLAMSCHPQPTQQETAMHTVLLCAMFSISVFNVVVVLSDIKLKCFDETIPQDIYCQRCKSVGLLAFCTACSGVWWSVIGFAIYSDQMPWMKTSSSWLIWLNAILLTIILHFKLTAILWIVSRFERKLIMVFLPRELTITADIDFDIELNETQSYL
jgi:hypothetical protein